MKRVVILIVLAGFLTAVVSGCSTVNSMNNTQRGALYGGALGALGGAVIGNQMDQQGGGGYRY